MNAQSTTYGHIEITQSLVRLYIFLTQHLDRCLSEAGSETYPEHELQAQLASTRAEMMEILSVNPVVKEKVEQECKRAFTLTAACLAGEAGKAAAREEVIVERAVLKSKTMALSDLLAVFRAT